MFVPQSSSLIFPVSHCFRAWSKINLKVYDINCLNKNLITHFVWYLGKKVWHWNLSIDRVLNKEHFYAKSRRKSAAKASSKPIFYFDITQNNHYMQEILLTIRYHERGYQKALKKLTLLFLANPVPFSGQS